MSNTKINKCIIKKINETLFRGMPLEDKELAYICKCNENDVREIKRIVGYVDLNKKRKKCIGCGVDIGFVHKNTIWCKLCKKERAEKYTIKYLLKRSQRIKIIKEGKEKKEKNHWENIVKRIVIEGTNFLRIKKHDTRRMEYKKDTHGGIF